MRSGSVADFDIVAKRLADIINNHMFLVVRIMMVESSADTDKRHAWSMEALESAILDVLEAEKDDGISEELQRELDSLAEEG